MWYLNTGNATTPQKKALFRNQSLCHKVTRILPCGIVVAKGSSINTIIAPQVNEGIMSCLNFFFMELINEPLRVMAYTNPVSIINRGMWKE